MKLMAVFESKIYFTCWSEGVGEVRDGRDGPHEIVAESAQEAPFIHYLQLIDDPDGFLAKRYQPLELTAAEVSEVPNVNQLIVDFIKNPSTDNAVIYTYRYESLEEIDKVAVFNEALRAFCNDQLTNGFDCDLRTDVIQLKERETSTT